MKPIPHWKENPHFRTPSEKVHPESHDKKHVRFRFDLVDFDHEWWGWNKLEKQHHLEVLKFLQSIEKQTWAEIKLAAGGKRHGTNHHSLEIAKFSKKAKQRIQESNLEPVLGDELFSLRMNNVTRLYGHREDNYFRILWHDPYHDHLEKAAYPVK